MRVKKRRRTLQAAASKKLPTARGGVRTDVVSVEGADSELETVSRMLVQPWFFVELLAFLGIFLPTRYKGCSIQALEFSFFP